ncbi:MAG: glycosyl transferase group 1 protein, partial [bacterium F083]
NNVSDVCFVNDAVFKEKKYEILKNASVFIQTSRSEGQPVGIIESICCGLPCIVTPGTSFYDYVKENNVGYSCELNPDSIAKAMMESFNNQEGLKEKSNNAKKCGSKDFSWETIEKRTIEIYKKIIEEKGELDE